MTCVALKGVWLKDFLSPLVPPLCPLCYTIVQEDHTLCGACWKKVAFISMPFCKGCGQALECSNVIDALCGRCLTDPFPFDEARAVFKYSRESRPLVLRLKYGDATYLAKLLAQWMAWDKDYVADVDMILPVPLHWTRLWKRGFNQAALMAKQFSGEVKIPFHTHILKRIKATPSQGKLSKEERERHMKNAFHVASAEIIRGKTILLVDDVMASGATLRSCTNTLLTAGAGRVKVKVACKSNV